MDYFSIQFLILSIITFIFISVLKNNLHKKIVLILSSILFLYFWNFKALIILIVNSFLVFEAAKRLDKTPKNKQRGIAFFVIAIQVLLLGITRIFSKVLPTDQNVNPLFFATQYIGVAFYVLQNISYIIDVYQKAYLSEKSFLNYLTYIIYFPKILLGPIERFDIFYKKLEEPITNKNYLRSAYLIMLGLFKKFVITSRFMLLYHEIYKSYPLGQPLLIFWLNALFGLFVIYSEFSAYMNIGQGVSELFGISLTENFNQPYFAKSPIDYWQRWHISLSNWIRDYVFFPIMLKFKNIYFSIVVSFFVVGLWHGFKIDYQFWALSWAIFQIFYLILKKYFPQKNVGIFATYNLSALIGMYTFQRLFYGKQLIDLHSLIDSSGLYVIRTNFHLLIFCLLIVYLETMNKKTKSNNFYLNSLFLLVFLTSAFMISNSYIFFYLKL